MPFLLLTQGDSIGLDLLRKLVDARYGGSPPAMDSVRVTYQGWSSARLGPLPLKAQVDAVATYRFPFEMRWEFKVRLLRFMRSRYTTAFDGKTVYEDVRTRVNRITDPAQVESARARAWAEAVYFVSPIIADHDVHVKNLDNHVFQVLAPGMPDTSVTVRLSPEGAMAAVEVERLDPGDGQVKRQRICPAGDLKRVDSLIMPERMERYWGDDLFMSLWPVKVELNPPLDAGTFRLEQEDLLAVLDEDTASEPEGTAPDGDAPDDTQT